VIARYRNVLGAWEYAERDIVNLRAPYANVAADPLGKEPPVGGEINIYPGKSPEEVADRVAATIEWFRKQGDTPTVSCRAHGHVHVRVKGLRDDIGALKRLTKWIVANHELVKQVHAYKEEPLMAETKTARIYLKWDGARPMPDWMAENIISKATTFDDFIQLQCCGKDGVSRGRPFRYAINTYCLKHTETIEFRFFRGSLDYLEILGSLRLAGDMLDTAIDGGPNLKLGDYDLPEFFYDHASYLGWERTHYGDGRGKKERYFRDV
jgi:hypothetical protein